MTPGPQGSAEAAFLTYVERRQGGESVEVEEFLAAQDPSVRSELRGLIEGYEALRLSAPESPSLEPLEFGDYLLLGELGRGASAVVWEAVEGSLDRRVALKRLHPIFSFSGKALRRFLREARAAAGLDHAGIIKVYATGEHEGVPFIAQELVPGGRTLSDWLRERRQAGPFDRVHDREVARLVMLVADALACAHEAGVVHRDLKPSNILLTPEDMPKVADFGLALVAGDLTMTRSNDVVGTYAYMSPEQVQGERKAVDQRSDIFAVGTTLHELLTGARPFREQSALDLRASICEDRLRDPRALRPEIPAPLAAICIKALRRNPESRYQAMSQLSADLRAFLEGRQVSAHTPGRGLRAWYAMRERPRLTAAVSGLGVTALASLGLLVFVNGERALAEFEADLSSQLLLMQDELHLPQGSQRSHARLAELTTEARARFDGRRKLLALEKLGYSARRLGDTGTAILLFREALELHALAGSSDSPSAQEDLRALGWCLTVELRFEEAAALYEQGFAHSVPDSLEAELLVAAYVDTLLQGRLEDRLLRYLQEEEDPLGRLEALVERLKLERPDHRLVQFNLKLTLASFLQLQLRREEARELISECLEYCEQSLPLEDPLRLRVMISWSKVFGDTFWMGREHDWSGVISQLEGARVGIVERYGRLHPLAALTHFELARAAHESLAVDELSVEELYAAAQEGFAGLGPDHLYSLLLRQHLWNRRWYQADLSESEALARECRALAEDFTAALGPYHSDTLNCWRAASALFGLLGDREAAQECVSWATSVPRERMALGVVARETWATFRERISYYRWGRTYSDRDLFRPPLAREDLLRDADALCLLSLDSPPEAHAGLVELVVHALQGYCCRLIEVGAPGHAWDLLTLAEVWLEEPRRSQQDLQHLPRWDQTSRLLRAQLLESYGEVPAALQQFEAWWALESPLLDSTLGGYSVELVRSGLRLTRRLNQPEAARRLLGAYFEAFSRGDPGNQKRFTLEERSWFLAAIDSEAQRTTAWLIRTRAEAQPRPPASPGAR